MTNSDLGRPAIVPITNFGEYLGLLARPREESQDLHIIVESDDEIHEGNMHQAGIPNRRIFSELPFTNMTDNGAAGYITRAQDQILRLIFRHRYRRVIFFAKVSNDYEMPMIEMGDVGFDVKLFVTEWLYGLGPYVSMSEE